MDHSSSIVWSAIPAWLILLCGNCLLFSTSCWGTESMISRDSNRMLQRWGRQFSKQSAIVGRKLPHVPEAPVIGHICNTCCGWISAPQLAMDAIESLSGTGYLEGYCEWRVSKERSRFSKYELIDVSQQSVTVEYPDLAHSSWRISQHDVHLCTSISGRILILYMSKIPYHLLTHKTLFSLWWF